MKFTQLEKAKKIYLRIQEIDKEVIDLEKTMQDLINSNHIISVSIDIEKSKKTEYKDPYEDQDHYMGMFPLIGLRGNVLNDNSKDEERSYKLIESQAIVLVGTLIKIREKERNIMLRDLIELGVTP